MADVSDVIKQKYDNSLKEAVARLWGGIRQIANSSFGKGALITGGVVLAGAALTFGFGAAMGEITVNYAPATIGQGLFLGAGKAAQFLLNPLGWVTMAGGGVIGAVASRSSENRVSPADAQKMAQYYEARRAQAMQQPQQMQQQMPQAQPAQHVEPQMQQPQPVQQPQPTQQQQPIQQMQMQMQQQQQQIHQMEMQMQQMHQPQHQTPPQQQPPQRSQQTQPPASAASSTSSRESAGTGGFAAGELQRRTRNTTGGGNNHAELV